MKHYPRDLSRQPFTDAEQAAAWAVWKATGIRPMLLLECMLRGDFMVLSHAQETVLVAHLDKVRLDGEARQVYRRIMASPEDLLVEMLSGLLNGQAKTRSTQTRGLANLPRPTEPETDKAGGSGGDGGPGDHHARR